jgi:hypothetical protein
MATLTGELISETYDSLLKVTDNNTITGVKKRITDGFGNEIPLQLSSTDVEIDGTLILSALTDLEAATKFLSLKADNSVAYRTASEVLSDIGGASSSSISGTTGNIAKFTSTGAVGNSILEEIGNAIHLTDGTSSYASFGIINPGIPGEPGVNNDAYIGSTINNDFLIRVNNTEALRIDTALRLTIANIQNATTDTDKFLVSDGGVVKYRTGTELRSDIGAGVGSVTSVGLTMPVAFSVANSPITSSGTLEVTAIGTASQYIRGDGTLATIPSTSSGGANVNYYLNGSVAASVATYKQMANSAVIGGGTDFNLTGNGLISQFLTDAGNPNRLLIPGGAWNFEMYFNISSSGGNSKFYVELLKYDGTTFTSIASSSAVPEEITGGITTDLYITSLAVPETVLLITDRLALRVYIVNNSGGRTVTFHTEDNTLCLVTTTFAGGIAALNGLTANTQYFATGTTGTDFNISSLVDTHTFNLPTASATNRGALSSANWTTFNNKENVLSFSSPLVRTLNTISIPAATSTINGYLSSTDWSTFNNKQNTITLTTTGTSGAATFISNTLNIPQYTVLSLAAIGITPNANGASIVGSLLSLQPADASFGGVVTTGAQTIAGAKTFSSDLIVNGINIGRGGGNEESNTRVGKNALIANTTGIQNTASGHFSLSSNTTGNNNTAFGKSSGDNNTTGYNNIFVGMNSNGESATENNRTWIGNTDTTSTWLGGNLLLGSRNNATSDKLQVTGGAKITGIITLGTAGGSFVYDSAGSLILQTGASARLTINSAGNTTLSGTLNGTSATFSGDVTSGGASQNLFIANGTTYSGLKLNRAGVDKWAIFNNNAGTDYLDFYWYGSSPGSKLILNPSGNLGLGVTPSAWSTNNKAFQIGNTSIIYNGFSQSYFGNNFYNNTAGQSIYLTNNSATLYVQQTDGIHSWLTAPSGTAGNAITFTQAMTLDASGRLGVGTTTPSYLLTVGQAGTTADSYIQIASTSTGTGNLFFGDATGGGTASYSGYIQYQHGVDSMVFGTSNTERMRITSGGNVLIGTTTDAGYKLDVNGTGRFNNTLQISGNAIKLNFFNSGYENWYLGTKLNTTQFVIGSGTNSDILSFGNAGAATFSSSVTATAFFESSDSRLKTLITDNYQAKGIESITAKLYTKNGVEELGYFAQDVQSVLPSAVIERDDTYLDLSYRQVHTAKIANLENRIKQLEDLIKQLI